MTLSNSDVLRMREGAATGAYDRPPASPTGFMPQPYRSAIKRSSAGSTSAPTSPTVPNVPRLVVDSPEADNSKQLGGSTSTASNAVAGPGPSTSSSAAPALPPPVTSRGSSSNLLSFLGGSSKDKGKQPATPRNNDGKGDSAVASIPDGRNAA